MKISILLSLLPIVAAAPSLTSNGVGTSGSHDVSHSSRMGKVSVEIAERIADSQFHFEDYELTDVCFDCSRPGKTSQYSCSMNFDWYDPNSKLENNVTSCTCSYNWTWSGETDTTRESNAFEAETYTSCFVEMPVFFEMKVTSFAGGDNFSLSLGHRYKDSFNFTPPWDYPTTFSDPTFSIPVRRDDSNSLTWYDPGPLYAKITQCSD